MFNGAYGGYDQFGQSNSLIGMFAFILLILLIFMVLLRVGVSILSVIFAPDGSPHLIDGMVPGDSLMVFDQYPGTPGSKTVYRSKNQNGGIEFTWSVWLYIQDVDAKDGNKYRHIFSKGNPQQYATRYNPTGGIDQPDIEEIISVRTDSPFKSKRDLLKRINSIQGNDCVNFLKVSSNYFIVHGLVKIDKVIFNGSSLLDRTSGKTRLLWSRI